MNSSCRKAFALCGFSIHNSLHSSTSSQFRI